VLSNDDLVHYKKTYAYKTLYPGEMLFGRALTGLDIEGEPRPDHVRMTIVSTSYSTRFYCINRNSLQFCPDFLVEHILIALKQSTEVDLIHAQPLNKQIK
jgi:hypothetical protein